MLSAITVPVLDWGPGRGNYNRFDVDPEKTQSHDTIL